ncbi:flagellar hook-associated protein FlgL [Lysobacter humi (ex Lee et al. 2017)]
MTMRISTAGLHQQGLTALLNRQSELARTQQQLSTGSKLQRAADDPTGMAQTQRLDHAVASLEHFGRSADLLDNRLRAQEGALGDAGDYLNRARELAVQANNATISRQDRALIATEIRQLRSSLIAVANRTDGNGRALFAGQRDGVVPFTDAAGTVTYHGDDGQNRVDVGPDVALIDADPGSEVFMRALGGDGEIRGRAGASNTGTGVLQSVVASDPSVWAGRSLSLQFTSPTQWQVVDAANAVVGTGTYAGSDATLTVAGVTTRITGSPATGDSFAIAPAPRQDVFSTLQQLADVLVAPQATPAELARVGNGVGAALRDIATAQEHFIGFRTSTGARLAALEATADDRAESDISLRSTLSGLRDVDYAEASSRLSLQLTAIEAAQRSMLRVQSLSLFDKL